MLLPEYQQQKRALILIVLKKCYLDG